MTFAKSSDLSAAASELRAMNDIYEHCKLCPRKCGADRSVAAGFCGEGNKIRIARAALHKWEEPPVCTGNGSGAVFFSGCSLRCCYCQNYEISHLGKGYEISEKQLGEIMLRLQDEGACNINLVSAAHFVPSVIGALDRVKGRLSIPVMYNSSGYESPETLDMLNGYIDIYLPDLKYHSSELSERYSGAADYFEVASEAVIRMARQVGKPVLDENSAMKRGVIVRHLVLPSHRDDSAAIMDFLGRSFAKDDIFLSVMRQYTPVFKSGDYKEINRRLTSFEYDRVLDAAEKYGFRWFIQEKASADEAFIPQFFGEDPTAL